MGKHKFTKDTEKLQPGGGRGPPKFVVTEARRCEYPLRGNQSTELKQGERGQVRNMGRVP